MKCIYSFHFQQIKAFLLKLLHHPIKFAPFGLFEINLGLFSMVDLNFTHDVNEFNCNVF